MPEQKNRVEEGDAMDKGGQTSEQFEIKRLEI